VFEERRKQLKAGGSARGTVHIPAEELNAMAETARKRDGQYMFHYKLRAAVDSLAKEFPRDQREWERQGEAVVAWVKLKTELVERVGGIVRFIQQQPTHELVELLNKLLDYGNARGVPSLSRASGFPRSNLALHSRRKAAASKLDGKKGKKHTRKI
jgi:hypothetical protein